MLNEMYGFMDLSARNSDVTSEPSGDHFSKRGHNVAHLKGLVLEQVRNSDPFILKTREHLLIQKFDTFRSGLNKEP